MMLDAYLLSLIIFIPLVGALLVAFLPTNDEKQKNIVRGITFAILTIGFLVSLKLWFDFDTEQAGMQFTERKSWIPAFGIEYYLAVDGLSVLMVLLTTFLGPLVMAGSWSAIQDRVRGFCIALLILQGAMLGAFMALDLFLFYIFWELMLFPLYFIIGIWGGKRRIYAAIKLFVYTMFGSLFMLVAVLYVAINQGTFDIIELYNNGFSLTEQVLLFGAFALAFAIKVPMFPFHTWLPDAHVEAPTAGSVILAGVLLKMGTYGFMRFAMPMFPDAITVFSPYICTLALIGIVYGACVAMVQPDVKKLVAYSSVSHLGYVILGLFTLNAQGIQGGILQMVNHGISTGALFLLVGMIYERRHTRMIKDFGGIARVMPVYTFFFMMVTFSSIGLPGLNGFVGEMLILLGAFEFNIVYAIFAALGVVLGAVYMLWMFRRVFFGPLTHDENRKLKDLNGREIGILSALLIFIVWIGVYPSSFLSFTEKSVEQFIEQTQPSNAGGVSIRVSPSRGDHSRHAGDIRRAQPQKQGIPSKRRVGPRRDADGKRWVPHGSRKRGLGGGKGPIPIDLRGKGLPPGFREKFLKHGAPPRPKAIKMPGGSHAGHGHGHGHGH